jgi:hypothetical protein
MALGRYAVFIGRLGGEQYVVIARISAVVAWNRSAVHWEPILAFSRSGALLLHHNFLRPDRDWDNAVLEKGDLLTTCRRASARATTRRATGPA